MTRFLTLEEALRVAETVIGETPAVRDIGLLESALARPQASLFGDDAYPTLEEKAAAMLQSLVLNHALIDGNKRLGFACTSVFLTLNGAPLALDDESQAYDLVMVVATSELTEVADIASRLRPHL
ncbi:type II toxin-antitoxin system death-on-curing family toxin [Aeromicrobium sp. CTD01-1L150]|uniref:type II toxin-antitoxin system death-on-curing family toxin n=1 Tax=Aeromicrobium sp. CTD01-1L150 TaxID=3341830 RepID=UPI0035C223AB